jgi:hypothetical protein
VLKEVDYPQVRLRGRILGYFISSKEGLRIRRE